MDIFYNYTMNLLMTVVFTKSQSVILQQKNTCISISWVRAHKTESYMYM